MVVRSLDVYIKSLSLFTISLLIGEEQETILGSVRDALVDFLPISWDLMPSSNPFC